MQVTRFIGGIISILFGLFFVVFHSKLSDMATRNWYKRFPDIKIWKYGDFILFFVGGMVFIVLGVLELIGVIKMHK